VKIPPVLLAPSGTVADQATADLLAACEPLGRFIVSLPPSDERDRARVHFNEALLWAQQAILRALPDQRVIVAPPGALNG
jgi:hypothetical protein